MYNVLILGILPSPLTLFQWFRKLVSILVFSIFYNTQLFITLFAPKNKLVKIGKNNFIGLS